jgi:hypothetical protein
VVAAGGDFDPLIGTALSGDAINQAMIAGDTPGPPTGKITFERFGFAKANERPAEGVFNQVIELPENGLVLSKPMLVIVPGSVREMDIHLREVAFVFAKLRCRVPPASAARIDRSSRSAFTGLANK